MKLNQTTIKKLRESLGWTQQQLADELSVSRNTINRWEIGTRNPSKSMRSKLDDLANGIKKSKVDTKIDTKNFDTRKDFDTKIDTKIDTKKEIDTKIDTSDTSESVTNKNDNINKDFLQDEINAISNENPFYETVPGGYRESYQIIRCQPHLSSAEKLLYDELVYYYTQSGKNGQSTAYPSQRTLARKLGISRSAVWQLLKRLSFHKLIRIQDRKSTQGKEYVLLEYPLRVWNNYFRLLETELSKARTETEKERKKQALEVAKKKLQLQRNFQHVRILTSPLEFLRGTLENLTDTLENLTVGQNSQGSNADDKSDCETASGPINQNELSESINHHHARSNVNVGIGQGDKRDNNPTNSDDDIKNNNIQKPSQSKSAGEEKKDLSGDDKSKNCTQKTKHTKVDKPKASSEDERQNPTTSDPSAPPSHPDEHEAEERLWQKFRQRSLEIDPEDAPPAELPKKQYSIAQAICARYSEEQISAGLDRAFSSGETIQSLRYVAKCIKTFLKEQRKEQQRQELGFERKKAEVVDPAVEAARIKFRKRREKRRKERKNE